MTLEDFWNIGSQFSPQIYRRIPMILLHLLHSEKDLDLEACYYLVLGWRQTLTKQPVRQNPLVREGIHLSWALSGTKESFNYSGKLSAHKYPLWPTSIFLKQLESIRFNTCVPSLWMHEDSFLPLKYCSIGNAIVPSTRLILTLFSLPCLWSTFKLSAFFVLFLFSVEELSICQELYWWDSEMSSNWPESRGFCIKPKALLTLVLSFFVERVQTPHYEIGSIYAYYVRVWDRDSKDPVRMQSVSWPVVVAHIFNPGIQEAEVVGSLWVQGQPVPGQPRLHCKTLS